MLKKKKKQQLKTDVFKNHTAVFHNTWNHQYSCVTVCEMISVNTKRVQRN